MLRKKEILIVLFIGAMCFSALGAETRTITTRNPKTGETISKQVPVAPKEADPFEDTSVLVEAFVVRVSTEALAEVGVNPIGQAPEGISILKILACLNDPDEAEVISGAKVTAVQNKQARIENRKTLYVKKETGRQTVTKQGPVAGSEISINSYDSGRTFSIVPHVQTDGPIRVEATFSYSGIVINEDKSMPPGHISFDWSGVITAHSGKPVIASAVQDEENITFLILTATIQDAESD